MTALERIDPGEHRRVKGLRLVAAYGVAAMVGALIGGAHALTLSTLAGGFALWASVSEGQTTRSASSRDLLALNAAAVLGAFMSIGLGYLFGELIPRGAELTLVSGAFLVGYLKRFGTLGSGVGSQIYIGQLLAYGARLTIDDVQTVVLAGTIAAVGSIIPRMLSGPGEYPPSVPVSISSCSHRNGGPSPESRMGLQAALAALVIVVMNSAVGLEQSTWAVTACTYVIAGSAAATLQRVRRRVAGTLVGVPLGLLFLSFAGHLPLILWGAAALAMVIYAMALPERYDVSCGAYAFTLLMTLAATGERSTALLAARAWETVLGGVIGVAAALIVLPLRSARGGEIRSGGV